MNGPRRVAAPPARPLLLFDGDCGFCRRWILRWKVLTGDRVDYAPSQEAGSRFPEIAVEDFRRSVQLVLPDGRVFSGAEAVFASLSFAPRGGRFLSVYRRVPGFAALTEWIYRLIARHRGAASALTAALWGKTVERPTYRIANALFLRLLGLCYLAAFVSLWVQVEGLIGSRGILPVKDLLEAVRAQLGGERWTLFPTLGWLNPGDAFLHFLCGGGALAALLVVLGLVPAPALLVCWIFSLSLSVAGQAFLEFQWDLLLLEAGFLGIWLAPLRRWRVGAALDPPWVPRALLCWLLFRLMFSSGFVKLASGDPTWRNLTALAYHYWTQPLPPWTAWFAAQLPLWFHKVSCFVMFAIELGAPFLIVAPRRLRLISCAAMAGLQAIIAATGNYAFFNPLALALCVLLVDDASFPRTLRARAARDSRASRGRWPALVLAPGLGLVLIAFQVLIGATGNYAFFNLLAVALCLFLLDDAVLARWFKWLDPAREERPGPPRWLAWPVAGLLAVLGLVLVAGLADRRVMRAGPVRWAFAVTGPLHLVNSYGLFAIMTTTRPEIVVQGSADGETWRDYAFPWKPGDPARRPGFVAPHQPRLDWQMWFAALGDCRGSPWLLGLFRRLLEGSPPVLGLLAGDPFPEGPPRYVRALVHDYRFTDPAERARSGRWWRTGEPRLFCPAVSLE